MPCIPAVKHATPPMLMVAHGAGVGSGNEGKGTSANPYWPEDPRHAVWLRGYAAGVEIAATRVPARERVPA